MAPRADLQALLEEILGTDEVYFQPPANIELSYPCIIYKRERFDSSFGNNQPYALFKGYQVTVIDRDPDSVIVDKVAELPMTRHDRSFAVDNLNHDVFTLYF